MSYELSFSPEFFLAEGEPYDGGHDHGDRPTSVWGAIECAMKDTDTLQELADLLGCKPEHVTAETVLDKVRETNTCSNLGSPVRVWVDPEGYIQLEVYD
jgi:hypothetical protein